MTLDALRQTIDELDKELIQILVKRMEIVQEVAITKKRDKKEIIQKNRWQELLATRSSWGEDFGLPAEDIKSIFECIHDMSVNRQKEIIG